MENKFEKPLNEIVKKWTNVTEHSLYKDSYPMDYSKIINYYEKTPQVIAMRKYCKTLQLIKEKAKKNYNLALVVDSGTYEQYCEQFEYFLNDYQKHGGAFEIWEEDKFSFKEYNLLREMFVYD